MTTEVGKLDVEYLEISEGIIGKFATYLASNANRIGNYCALGFYRLELMEQVATEFIDLYPIERQEVDELYAWVQALPWKEAGYLVSNCISS